LEEDSSALTRPSFSAEAASPGTYEPHITRTGPNGPFLQAVFQGKAIGPPLLQSDESVKNNVPLAFLRRISAPKALAFRIGLGEKMIFSFPNRSPNLFFYD